MGKCVFLFCWMKMFFYRRRRPTFWSLFRFFFAVAFLLLLSANLMCVDHMTLKGTSSVASHANQIKENRKCRWDMVDIEINTSQLIPISHQLKVLLLIFEARQCPRRIIGCARKKTVLQLKSQHIYFHESVSNLYSRRPPKKAPEKK